MFDPETREGFTLHPSALLSCDTAGSCRERRCRLFCLSARGNLFARPQMVHFRTSTFAQGFFSPLLLFSISLIHVDPSISIVLQFLHIEFFIVGDIRICILRETSRRSETNRRETGRNVWSGDVFVSLASVLVADSVWTSVEASIACGGPECCCLVARYIAA